MKVPDNYMAAGILLLAVFGTYSIQNDYSDVLIMFVLGTLMYFGSKAGFSPVPVVLRFDFRNNDRRKIPSWKYDW